MPNVVNIESHLRSICLQAVWSDEVLQSIRHMSYGLRVQTHQPCYLLHQRIRVVKPENQGVVISC